MESLFFIPTFIPAHLYLGLQRASFET